MAPFLFEREEVTLLCFVLPGRIESLSLQILVGAETCFL